MRREIVTSRGSRRALCGCLAGLLLLAWHAPALSYVGPGAGIGILSALFAMVLAVLATIVGLVLWPIRKFRQWRKRSQATKEKGSEDTSRSEMP
jgi:membrane protein implicated in regulation of membrane protease activity